MIDRVIYTADAVYNGVGLPLENGGVLVSRGNAAQTIVAFGKLATLKTQFPNAQEIRLGRAILPKPINAHTHLDMSTYPFRALPYFDWIPQVVLPNRELRGVEAAKRGLEALRASNVAAFGDIVWDANTMDFLLEQSDTTGVAYWEVFEPDPNKADQVFASTIKRILAWRKHEVSNGMRVGITPHTPFTVSAKLLRMLAEFSKSEHLPMQIHVAEHPSELELFRTGQGALAHSFAPIMPVSFEKIWGRAAAADFSPVQHLAEIGVLDAKPTLIHMVNVTEQDVQIVAQMGCTVVSCPRSNRNLECGTFPWALYAKYGVEVGLGTDSVASGQTLNIFDEANAALKIHGDQLGIRHIARWAVKGSYKALSLKPPIVQRGDAFSSLTVWE